MPFHIIPALDILDGRVVSAGGRGQQRYRPLRSRLTTRDEPAAVIRALLAHHPFRCLYLADLNALRRGDHSATNTLADLAVCFPDITIWLDGAAPAPARPGTRLRTVYGSEWASPAVTDEADWEQAILSLDSIDGEPLGAGDWWEQPSLWPQRVIAIDMHRVGSQVGPNWQWLDHIRKLAGPRRRIWAGGGVRHNADLLRLHESGLQGSLVSSALHTGRVVPGKGIAAE